MQRCRPPRLRGVSSGKCPVLKRPRELALGARGARSLRLAAFSVIRSATASRRPDPCAGPRRAIAICTPTSYVRSLESRTESSRDASRGVPGGRRPERQISSAVPHLDRAASISDAPRRQIGSPARASDALVCTLLPWSSSDKGTKRCSCPLPSICSTAAAPAREGDRGLLAGSVEQAYLENRSAGGKRRPRRWGPCRPYTSSSSAA